VLRVTGCYVLLVIVTVLTAKSRGLVVQKLDEDPKLQNRPAVVDLHVNGTKNGGVVPSPMVKSTFICLPNTIHPMTT
jgi:hypothetical protein